MIKVNKKAITEYQIIFKEGNDFYSEDKAEYDALLQEIVNNGDLDLVSQCIKKDYVWDEERETYIEDWVEILYEEERGCNE